MKEKTSSPGFILSLLLSVMQYALASAYNYAPHYISIDVLTNSFVNPYKVFTIQRGTIQKIYVFSMGNQYQVYNLVNYASGTTSVAVLLSTANLHTTTSHVLEPRSVKELKGPNASSEYVLIGTNVANVGIIRINNLDNSKSLGWGGVKTAMQKIPIVV